jgi:pilus assembly protein Flp/PilA
MKVLIARFACDEGGATAVEYGLIAAAMSAAIITMMFGLGTGWPQVTGCDAPFQPLRR